MIWLPHFSTTERLQERQQWEGAKCQHGHQPKIIDVGHHGCLALEQRTYDHPVETLKEMLQAWQRQQEAAQMQEMKKEIDSMIEGRIPMDARKAQAYHDLSRRLKGSRPSIIISPEAPTHG